MRREPLGLDLQLNLNLYSQCMSTLTIGQVAERTGFTASALRYYEVLGLVMPTTRTDAGYRLYGDDTVNRLAFIARAKQLGCSLDEITDLLAIWDGDRCAPVQRRFHELVTEKIGATQAQIAELVAFASQLQTAAARWIAHRLTDHATTNVGASRRPTMRHRRLRSCCGHPRPLIRRLPAHCNRAQCRTASQTGKQSLARRATISDRRRPASRRVRPQG